MHYNQVLLIDDDEDDHEIFLTALTQALGADHYIGETSCVGALQKLDSGAMKPDIIFLDLNMPVMDGQTFLAEIKKRDNLKDIPVMILSTSSNPNTIRAIKALGAVEVITKPSSFKELKSILQSILS